MKADLRRRFLESLEDLVGIRTNQIEPTLQQITMKSKYTPVQGLSEDEAKASKKAYCQSMLRSYTDLSAYVKVSLAIVSECKKYKPLSPVEEWDLTDYSRYLKAIDTSIIDSLYENVYGKISTEFSSVSRMCDGMGSVYMQEKQRERRTTGLEVGDLAKKKKEVVKPKVQTVQAPVISTYEQPRIQPTSTPEYPTATASGSSARLPPLPKKQVGNSPRAPPIPKPSSLPPPIPKKKKATPPPLPRARRTTPTNTLSKKTRTLDQGWDM